MCNLKPLGLGSRDHRSCEKTTVNTGCVPMVDSARNLHKWREHFTSLISSFINFHLGKCRPLDPWPGIRFNIRICRAQLYAAVDLDSDILTDLIRESFTYGMDGSHSGVRRRPTLFLCGTRKPDAIGTGRGSNVAEHFLLGDVHNLLPETEESATCQSKRLRTNHQDRSSLREGYA